MIISFFSKYFINMIILIILSDYVISHINHMSTLFLFVCLVGPQGAKSSVTIWVTDQTVGEMMEHSSATMKDHKKSSILTAEFVDVV